MSSLVYVYHYHFFFSELKITGRIVLDQRKGNGKYVIHRFVQVSLRPVLFYTYLPTREIQSSPPIK